MIIADLDHLEVVHEENRVSGGAQQISTATGAASGLATTGTVNVNSNSFTSASEQPFVTFTFPDNQPIVVGTLTQTTASSFASGSNIPPVFFPF